MRRAAFVAAPPPVDINAGRIARIRTFHLSLPLQEPLGTAQAWVEKRETLLVQVETTNGESGWGECAGPPPVAASAVCDFYAPYLLGKLAAPPDAAWQELWRAGLPWARRGAMLAGLSGLDMALWDLWGKRLGLPLCELWGGRMRERVPCLATGLYFRQRPEASLVPDLVDEAHELSDAGFRGVKAHIGRNLSFDTALIRALRKALPDVALFADARFAYDLPEAVAVTRALADENVSALENPLSPEHPLQLRQLADHGGVPLSAGRSEQTRWGFHELLNAGGVHHAQLDLTFCGGPSEGLKIRTVASAAGVNLSPISAAQTPVGLAAALHFLASEVRYPGRREPSLALLECDASPLGGSGFHHLFTSGLSIEHGMAHVPHLPGLGVTVDGAAMRTVCVGEREASS